MLHPGAWLAARRATADSLPGLRSWLGMGVSLATVGVALACGGVGSLDWALERRAEALVHLLQEGRVQDVAERFHYPETESEAERARDRASIQESLGFLLDRFGAPESAKRVKRPGPFDAIDIGAGDAGYWEKREAGAEARKLVYQARFGKMGPGIVAVTFRNLGETWVVQSVGIGLETAQPDAQKRMAAISKDLLAQLTSGGPQGAAGGTAAALPSDP
jgi:hypothetical protein